MNKTRLFNEAKTVEDGIRRMNLARPKAKQRALNFEIHCQQKLEQIQAGEVAAHAQNDRPIK
jgi:hypothetical protein